jgi:glycerol-3-phosphate dehydrogenase (NAD(P)+)
MGDPVGVGVLGGGPWGLSLARAARRAGARTVLCSRRHREGDLGGISVTCELAALADTPLILVAVPSELVRTVARELGDAVNGAHVIVHGVRGLSGEELATVSDVLRDETPARRLGALGGPVQARELSVGRPSALVVGSEFADVRRAVKQALAGPWLQVHATADLRGLEWASALVGCLSIGVGYARERVDIAPGLLAALVSRAVDEAAAIAVAAGADARTLYGLAGYGDLLSSMVLDDRPEVRVGRALARGASIAEARRDAELRVEAVDLVPRIARFARARGAPTAIFDALAEILAGSAAPETIVAALFGHG